MNLVLLFDFCRPQSSIYHKYGTKIFLAQNDHHAVIFCARLIEDQKRAGREN